MTRETTLVKFWVGISVYCFPSISSFCQISFFYWTLWNHPSCLISELLPITTCQKTKKEASGKELEPEDIDGRLALKPLQNIYKTFLHYTTVTTRIIGTTFAVYFTSMSWAQMHLVVLNLSARMCCNFLLLDPMVVLAFTTKMCTFSLSVQVPTE